MIAYHFTADKLRDGRPVPSVGEWLVHDGPVEICATGLHASKHPLDALQYAPGNFLHLVECEDIFAEQNDKFVCRRRKILKSLDAEDMLFEFARKQALSVIHFWDAPDVVRQYLETGDMALRAAAKDAARDAAWDAARAAARDAATATAMAMATATATAAARDAAWAAAWAAARDAARDAAWAAAWAAARQKQRDDFLAVVTAKFEAL